MQQDGRHLQAHAISSRNVIIPPKLKEKNHFLRRARLKKCMFSKKTTKAKQDAAAEPYADTASQSFHFLTEIEGLVDPAMDEAERFNSYEIIGAGSPAPLAKLYHTSQFSTVTLDEAGLLAHIGKSRAEGLDTRVTEHALQTLRATKK